MKNLLNVFMVAGTFLSLSAFAGEIPLGRALETATLSKADHGPTVLPRLETLTLHESAANPKQLVFVAVEDTGIRCITTPCPSSQTTQYRVTSVEQVDAQTKKYVAWQVLTNIPPNVRIAPRVMTVVDFAGFQQQWSVHVTNRLPGGAANYVGYPQPAEEIE